MSDAESGESLTQEDASTGTARIDWSRFTEYPPEYVNTVATSFNHEQLTFTLALGVTILPIVSDISQVDTLVSFPRAHVVFTPRTLLELTERLENMRTSFFEHLEDDDESGAENTGAEDA